MKVFNNWVFLIIAVFILINGSCRSKEKIASVETMAIMDEDKLVDNILSNELTFNSLFFRRLTVDFEENGKSRAVRANMYLKRDSAIIVSVIPLMGIEVFRVSISKKEIKIIDRLNRIVIETDYEELCKKYGVELSYNIVESLLSNCLFSYPDHNPSLIKKYTPYHQSDFYSLKSLNDKRVEKFIKRETKFYLHEINVTPGIFKVFETRMVSSLSGISIGVGYKNFESLKNTKFPKQIKINAKQGNKSYILTFDYNDIEVDGSHSLNFRLPENYEVVDL